MEMRSFVLILLLCSFALFTACDTKKADARSKPRVITLADGYKFVDLKWEDGKTLVTSRKMRKGEFPEKYQFFVLDEKNGFIVCVNIFEQ